ncbi:MAG TPA: TonB-dependent receptor, partial [Methylomirabilota bacterium]|nr:TonB-dependent receptor [Methylomirabilota bacterium]
MGIRVKLRLVAALVAMSLSLLGGAASWGQVLKGSISGTVLDPQNAAVVGAQVKATQKETGSVFNTTTDGSGSFRLNLIPAGEYKVEVSAQGFKTAVVNNLAVAAGADTSTGTLKLELGPSSTIMEVTAETPLIETTQAQVTNTFSGTTLQTFAGIQENEGLDNLALFVPGVTSSRDNNFANTNGGLGFQVNGLRGRSNDQEVDGQNNNDNSVTGPSLFVSDTEFVQQYVIITNQFGPEYGRNSGSVVNIITKSGGNNWHGSIYGVENNSYLNAMNNQEKQFLVDANGNNLTGPQKLNDEFGGFTIGGPIIKNKAFFFAGFNEQIINFLADFHSDFLTPTPAGIATLNACFPGSTGLQALNKIGPFSVSGGNPVPVPVPLDPNNPNGARAFLPLAIFNDAGALCDNVQFGGVSRFMNAPAHNFNWILRNDWQFGGNTLTARYIFSRVNNFDIDFGNAAAGFPVNVNALSQAILVSWTRNLTSRMVNEARVGFNRLNVDFGGNTIGSVPVGSNLNQALASVNFLFPSGFVCNGSAFGSAGVCGTALPNFPFLPMGMTNGFPQFRFVNTWQAQDNWTYVVGKHTLKAGVNWTYQRSPNAFLPSVNGVFQFDGWGDTAGCGTNGCPGGQPGASLVDNLPNRVQVASGPTNLDFREYDTFVYFGDDWKVRQNLTLNLGLTWTYYGQPANLFNTLTTAQQNSSTPFWNPALPLSVTTFPTFPAPSHNFGPSAGFAYSPNWGGFLTGHGKTTFRGGFRFLYDPPFYNIYLNMATAAPEVFLQTFTGGFRGPTSPAATTFPLPVIPTGPNVRAELAPALQNGVFDPRSFAETTMSPNFGPDKVEVWSLGFEREVSKNSAFEVRYVGDHAYDLFQSINGNPSISSLSAHFPNLVPAGLTPCPLGQVVPGPGQSDASSALGAGRVNCAQGVLRERTNGGYSFYNGLQMEFRSTNLFNQLTLRAAYTFSKTLDNVSEIFSSFGGGNTIAFAQNPLNTTTAEYGLSGLNIPHQVSLLFNENLPFFKQQHGLLGHLLGGWSLSANYIWASGQP